MHTLLRIRSAARSALGARGCRLSAERGDTLIEVVVAAVILVLIAGASLAGFDVANRSSADSKKHSQADQLAQQDQDRLRGLQVSDLISSLGNQSKNFTLDGTVFTVTSSAYFVSDTSGGGSCTSSGTANADYVKTTSTVTWPNMTRKAVVQEGIISPPAGGSMLVQVTDQAANPLAGASIVVTGTGAGTTPNSTATTDANGCAIFGGLINGAYNVTATDSGYVDPSGNASPTQAKTIVAGSTVNASMQLGKATQLKAIYQTWWNGSPPTATPPTPRTTNQDTWVAANPNLPAPNYRLFGTSGSFVQFVTTPVNIFPFTSAYTTYAGICDKDSPVLQGATAPTASVTPGGGLVTVTLTAPGLFIQPYSGSSGSTPMIGYPNNNNTTSTVPNRVVVTDNQCTDPSTGSLYKRVYSGAQLAASGTSNGVLVDPGQPYGSFKACAEYTERTLVGGSYRYFPQYTTATVSNSVPQGTTVPLYFAGAVGSQPSGATCP